MNLMKQLSDSFSKVYERKLTEEILANPLPNHIAIIMDGNRRFAEKLGLKPIEGHVMGRDKLEEVLDWCLELGIKIVTVYALSTENIMRTAEELKALLELFTESFRKAGDDERVHRNKVRIKAIGRVDILPREVQESIKYAEDRTKEHENYYLNIAIAYGGREEIVQAVRGIANDVKVGKLDESSINEELISSYLYTKDLPDPDLILRTSGEERISNFLLWQLAYSELYFADVYWPELRKIDFLRAIRAYQHRQRRFGE
ncbi:MAG: polyprenyl diphosphate synthase [Candidatus Thermoplasmatota archaeon]|nr:polyprenyl diphosphate synthase [Candidatus Thermoplasmatota archaeon]